MIATSAETVAASSAPFIAAVMVVGVLIVAALIWGFWKGNAIRRQEPPRPSAEEQPRLPEGGPVREESEVREPEEMPRTDDRLLPHELKATGSSKRSDDQHHGRWTPGSSGSFGSGGAGGRH